MADDAEARLAGVAMRVREAGEAAARGRAPEASALASLEADHQEAARAYIEARLGGDPYQLTRHHLDSYDELVGAGARQVVSTMRAIALQKLERDGTQVRVQVRLGTRAFRVDRPTVLGPGGVARPLLPNEARLADLTYAVRLYADVEVTSTVTRPTGEEEAPVVTLLPPTYIGSLPLMLHSRHCYLRGLGAAALREAGECPHDRGGYFLIDGKEKVLVTQEAPVPNRLYIKPGSDSAKEVAWTAFVRAVSEQDAFPRTTTLRVRSAQVKSRAGTVGVVVQHLTPAKERVGKWEVPLAVLFRALGVESDKAVLSHVLGAPASAFGEPGNARVARWLLPSLAQAAALGVTDQAAAIEYLRPATRYGSADEVKIILVEDLFPQVGRALAPKALMLGWMVRRVAAVALGEEQPNDQDDYCNKRLDASGKLVGDLFRDLFLRLRDRFQRRLDVEYAAGPWRNAGGLANLAHLVTPANVGQLAQGGIVTDGLRRAFKGAWGAAFDPDSPELTATVDDEESGVVQELSRVSYLNYVSHVRRVNTPLDRDRKIAEPHKLRASHWGVVCPVESPDGPAVGLLKHLAALCRVVARTTPLGPLLGRLEAEGLVVRLADVGRPERLQGACTLWLNDVWSAVAAPGVDAPALVARLRSGGASRPRMAPSGALASRRLATSGKGEREGEGEGDGDGDGE